MRPVVVLVVVARTAEISAKFEVDLIVLAERVFFRKKSVIGEEAHIAQAKHVVGHSENIEMIHLRGNGSTRYKVLIKGNLLTTLTSDVG